MNAATVAGVRVLLVSTYELGHQPLQLAVPAAALASRGHQVRCVDLAVDRLADDDVDWADAVACSVPMHTAMRLARRVEQAIHRRRPELALCVYGLYATLGAAGADLAIAGEYLPELLAWVDTLRAPDLPPSSPAGAPGAVVPSPGFDHCSPLSLCPDDPQASPGPGHHLAPQPGFDHGPPLSPTPVFGPHPVLVRLERYQQPVPDRRLLPSLDRYARLAVDGTERLAASVEASRGCAHRCRHCPVPVVYDGRTRLVDVDGLLADVTQLVAAGVEHVSFGDPDFLNRPRHARRVVAAVHGAYPQLTFDVTVKVEHILRHRSLWPSMAEAGCLFVVSAFESAEQAVLDKLAKGHDVADMVEAVRVLRAAGIEPRPSLMPFTPWSTADGIADLFDLVARCDLVGNVDPVQFAIRLLLPPGSLLLDDPDLAPSLRGYDDEALGWRWQCSDPRLDELAAQLATIAEQAAGGGWSAVESQHRLRTAVAAALGRPQWAQPPPPIASLASPTHPDLRPRLTEAWFCCAEPTAEQIRGVGATRQSCHATTEAPTVLPGRRR